MRPGTPVIASLPAQCRASLRLVGQLEVASAVCRARSWSSPPAHAHRLRRNPSAAAMPASGRRPVPRRRASARPRGRARPRSHGTRRSSFPAPRSRPSSRNSVSAAALVEAVDENGGFQIGKFSQQGDVVLGQRVQRPRRRARHAGMMIVVQEAQPVEGRELPAEAVGEPLPRRSDCRVARFPGHGPARRPGGRGPARAAAARTSRTSVSRRARASPSPAIGRRHQRLQRQRLRVLRRLRVGLESRQGLLAATPPAGRLQAARPARARTGAASARAPPPRTAGCAGNARPDRVA